MSKHVNVSVIYTFICNSDAVSLETDSIKRNMRHFLQRSQERRRSSVAVVDPTSHFRRSSSPGACQTGLNRLGIPEQNLRRGSWNGMTLGNIEERRASFAGPYSANGHVTLHRRKLSSVSDISKDKHPFQEKLSNKGVIKVIGGMMLLFILVLLASIYRFVT